MKIDILTLFPETIEPYLGTSIMKRAVNAGIMSFGVHDIRNFSTDVHKNVDDTPYGGGAGMVLQVEPIHRAVQSVCGSTSRDKTRIILLSAKGQTHTQQHAERYTAYEHLIFICGRYEGVDERVREHIVDEEVAIGDYVLTGGELGALVVADSVTRLLPGALGHADSAVHESHSTAGYLEHPHYTRPEEYNGWRVPEVLLGGDHGAIAQWRTEHSTRKEL